MLLRRIHRTNHAHRAEDYVASIEAAIFAEAALEGVEMPLYHEGTLQPSSGQQVRMPVLWITNAAYNARFRRLGRLDVPYMQPVAAVRDNNAMSCPFDGSHTLSAGGLDTADAEDAG